MYEKYYAEGDIVKKEQVTRFNFRITGSFMTIGKFKLFELQSIKGDAPADYCFLSIDKLQGVMIPDPYYQHRQKVKAMSPPAPKRAPTSFQPAPQKKVEPEKKVELQPTPAKKIEPHPQKSRGEEPRRELPKEKD